MLSFFLDYGNGRVKLLMLFSQVYVNFPWWLFQASIKPMMDQLPEVNMAKNTELGSINEGNNDTALEKWKLLVACLMMVYYGS